MNNHLLIVGITVLLICVGLSGCTNPLDPERNRFIGSWKADVVSWAYTFFSDGTCSIMGASGTYELKEGKLVVYTAGGQATTVWNYTFSNNDNTLTLEDVGGVLTLVFNKQ